MSRAQQIAYVLEAYGGFAHFQPVAARYGVGEMRGHHRACELAFQAAVLDQVLKYQPEHKVGGDPGSVRIYNSEAVRVSVAGEAQVKLVL